MKTKTRPWRHIYYDIGIPRPKATTSSFQNQKTVTSRFGDKNTTRLKRGTWNLDVVAFCPLKKRLGITMLWLICLRFSMSWFFGLGISMSWLFGLGISMSWFFGLGISMSWYMCLHGLAFVIIVKTKKSRIIMSIMLLKNISIVQIYGTSICIIHA